MTIKTKAVGVRFSLDLIERIERYRQERGINFTEALVGLIERGLGDEAEPIEALNNTLDERITSLIETKLDTLLDERVKQALDALLDSKNIPSDDSINSEFIAKQDNSECVGKCDAVELSELLTKCESVELGEESKADITIENHPITEENYTTQPKSFPFKAFYSYLDLTAPLKPNKTDADSAITVAKSRGIHGWEYISKNRKFVNNS